MKATEALESNAKSCTIVYMEVVADTNICFLAVVLNEPEKGHMIDLTSGFDVVAPEILLYEIGERIVCYV